MFSKFSALVLVLSVISVQSTPTLYSRDSVEIIQPANNTIVSGNINVVVRAARNGMAYLVSPFVSIYMLGDNQTIYDIDNNTRSMYGPALLENFGDNKFSFEELALGNYVVRLQYSLKPAYEALYGIHDTERSTWSYFTVADEHTPTEVATETPSQTTAVVSQTSTATPSQTSDDFSQQTSQTSDGSKLNANAMNNWSFVVTIVATIILIL